MPYILPSTTYGVRLADHYTLAWIERYTAPTAARRAAAADALVTAPVREAGAPDQHPWRADFLSARHLSAFAFSDAQGRPAITSDIRAYGGASEVGDWQGANASQPVVRGA